MKLKNFLKKLNSIQKQYGDNIDVVMADNIDIVEPICSDYRGKTKVIITDEKQSIIFAGSTDEKLQTCDFKIKQYRKLLSTLNVEVKYIYILNDWFKKPEYKDVLDYIISVDGCYYYFHYLPLQKIGLPVPITK